MKDSLKKDIIMEKELCNMPMEISMMDNGHMVKNKGLECTNGLMEIIMTGNGKKIQLKELVQLVLEECFMMVNSI